MNLILSKFILSNFLRKRCLILILPSLLSLLIIVSVGGVFAAPAMKPELKPSLKPGTYRATVSQTTTAIKTGETVEDNLKMELTVINIAKNGLVTAQMVLNREKGNLVGPLDSNGQLYLEGILRHSILAGEKIFKLQASVKGNSMIQGKYSKTSDKLRSTGHFAIAEPELPK